MSEKTKHTAVPWSVGGVYDGNGAERRRAITADDGTKYHRRVVIAEGCYLPNLAPDHPVHDANAELIVRAVNAHEGLLAAAKAVLPHPKGVCGHCHRSMGRHADWCAVPKLIAEIDKVEGRS